MTDTLTAETEAEVSTETEQEVQENPSEPTAEETKAEETETKDRRPRGWLETDVKSLTDRFVTGELVLEEGKALTPHRVARLVQQEGQLTTTPSTGAVAAVFKRWVELGFAKCSERPFGFLDYTDEGREYGLKALKEKRGEARKAARDAAKVEAKAEAQQTEESAAEVATPDQPAQIDENQG